MACFFSGFISTVEGADYIESAPSTDILEPFYLNIKKPSPYDKHMS